MTAQIFKGLLVPALTPFNSDLSPNTAAYVTHCKWVLEQGADGLAAFGTTSEANSLSGAERMAMLEALVGAGVPGAKLMPGTGVCSLTEAAQLTKHAVELGCGGVLMLPPFYYKGVSDDGLFAAYSEVIQRVGSSDLKIYLYHIPPVSQVPISLGLIGRLVEAYPETVVGLKDSSGDWSNTASILEAFPGFAVFPGSERFLLDGLRAGAVGCISASANVNPGGIRKVIDNWEGPDADALQAAILRVRETLEAYPMIPALKALAVDCHGDAGWSRMRPPLVDLGADAAASLKQDLAAIGFDMASSRDSISAEPVA